MKYNLTAHWKENPSVGTMAVTPGGAAWPLGGEPEGAPRDKPSPALEASSGPVTPGRQAPKSFDQEVVDFLMQVDEDLKDYKDKGNAATPCSDQQVVDFLKQVVEDLKDYKDKGNATTPCSNQQVVDFLMKVDEDLKDYKDKNKAMTPCSNQQVVDFKDKDKATTGTPDGHRSNGR